MALTTEEIRLELEMEISLFQNNIDSLSYKNSYDPSGTKKYTSHTFNANLIYAMALFERFIGKLITISLQRNNQLRRTYILLFESMIDKKIEQASKKAEKDKWKKYYNNAALMLKDYHIIEKELNQIVLIRELISFDTSNKHVKTFWREYVEIRERRNLLAHRGLAQDQQYLDNLRNNGIRDVKFIKSIYRKTGLWPTFIDWDSEGKKIISKPNLLDQPKNLSATPFYLDHALKTLFHLSMLLLIQINFRLGRGSNKHSLLNIIHEFLMTAHEDDVNVLNRAVNIYVYHKDINATDFKKFVIQDKVNLFLAIKLTLDILKKNKSHKVIKERINKYNRTAQSLLKLIEEDEYAHATEITKVLKYSLENNLNALVDITEKMLERKQISVDDAKNWLMFRAYQKKRKFKTMLKKFD